MTTLFFFYGVYGRNSICRTRPLGLIVPALIGINYIDLLYNAVYLRHFKHFLRLPTTNIT